MHNFVFHIPTEILFGKAMKKDFAKRVKALGNKALLVTGGGSVKRLGIFDTIVEALYAAGVETVECAGISPNPRLEEAKRGIATAKEENVDVILPIGGGSTIDCAKLIAAGSKTEGDPWDIVLGKVDVKEALPIAVVLTVAATGSEMDPDSVISNPKTKQKLGWASNKVLPRVSYLNPTFTYSVNAWHTAAGTADIMSHTMENYFSVDDSAFLQDSMAEAILRTCIKYGPIALEEPENEEARANLMWANSWAINGLLCTGKTQSWSVHAMEHELSAYYDITHGVGLAILTPHWLRHLMNDQTMPRLARFAERVFDIHKDSLEEQAEAGIQALSDFFRSLHIPMTLHEVGIDEEHLAEMAEHSVSRADGTIAGFQPLKKEDVEAIYRAAL